MEEEELPDSPPRYSRLGPTLQSVQAKGSGNVSNFRANTVNVVQNFYGQQYASSPAPGPVEKSKSCLSTRSPTREVSSISSELSPEASFHETIDESAELREVSFLESSSGSLELVAAAILIEESTTESPPTNELLAVTEEVWRTLPPMGPINTLVDIREQDNCTSDIDEADEHCVTVEEYHELKGFRCPTEDCKERYDCHCWYCAFDGSELLMSQKGNIRCSHINRHRGRVCDWRWDCGGHEVPVGLVAEYLAFTFSVHSFKEKAGVDWSNEVMDQVVKQYPDYM